jgi:hypothetical protein
MTSVSAISFETSEAASVKDSFGYSVAIIVTLGNVTILQVLTKAMPIQV